MSRQRSAAAIPQQGGTCVTVFRPGRQRAREREILRDYCAHAPQEVLLDGARISRRGVRRALIRETLEPWAGVRGGTVSIPLEGDVCHAWLLQHGIRQSRTAQ